MDRIGPPDTDLPDAAVAAILERAGRLTIDEATALVRKQQVLGSTPSVGSNDPN